MESTLPATLGVLSSMITPAMLISACASLIIATTGRLNRAVERTRELSRRFAELAHDESGVRANAEARMLFVQLDYSTSRSRYLQRALAGLYYSVGLFVATSVAIAVTTIANIGFVAPLALGIAGSALLLYASLVLVRESRLALVALKSEMDYLWAEGEARATEDLLALSRTPTRRKRRKTSAI